MERQKRPSDRVTARSHLQEVASSFTKVLIDLFQPAGSPRFIIECKMFYFCERAIKSEFRAPFRRPFLARGRDKRRHSHCVFLFFAPLSLFQPHFCVAALAAVQYKRQHEREITLPVIISPTAAAPKDHLEPSDWPQSPLRSLAGVSCANC